MKRNIRRHINIPIFIPHLGCPNNCVFCNQRSISGHGDFHRGSVRGELERALATVGEDCDTEIAFFGGSFTGIDREDMLFLLSLAREYVELGRVRSIRLSTRPDYIDGEILDILAEYKVTDIELGLQSLSDRVLAASKRGHTAACAIDACRLIKARGFGLVGQMMIGLPEASAEDELFTARELARLCDAARIYPTVVFSGTELCRMYESGEYRPLTLDEAVERSADALEIFMAAGKPVIRIGLCAGESLSDPERAVAGAAHSALGELVMGELRYKRIRAELEERWSAEALRGRELTIETARRECSKVVGQRRRNVLRLTGQYGLTRVRVIPKDGLSDGEFKLSIN